jgi:hypothetical protein
MRVLSANSPAVLAPEAQVAAHGLGAPFAATRKSIGGIVEGRE